MASISKASSQQSASAAAVSRDGQAPSSKAIKGPPLASTSHTFQLVVMLSLNTILLSVSLYLLPAHLLWRQAVKHHAGKGNDQAQHMGVLAQEAVAQSTANAHSTMRNMITALSILFGAPGSDTLTKKWIKSAIYSALPPMLLAQSWFVARFKGWFDEAEGMDRGDREVVLERRRIGLAKRMEDITLISFALPIPIALIYASIVLCGASVTREALGTLIFATYVGIFAALPALALLGTDESEWIKTFSQTRQFSFIRRQQPRFALLSTIITSTLIGAVIGSAGLLLDWDNAWQVYPVPPVLGAGTGAIIGNIVGGIAYLSSVPLRRTAGGAPRVERPAASSSAGKKKKR